MPFDDIFNKFIVIKNIMKNMYKLVQSDYLIFFLNFFIEEFLNNNFFLIYLFIDIIILFLIYSNCNLKM
jgi:hypothetical protein